MPHLQPQSAPEFFDLVPLTVEQYHRMLEVGILDEGEPIELLDGLLVAKDRGGQMTINPLHALLVNRLMRLAAKLEVLGAHLRLQCPITLPPNQEPEPDAVIVRGALEDFMDRHPTAEDVCCVIEIADSSLDRDRTTKQRIYATAGIGQYLLANLSDRQVEIYEDPAEGQYRHMQIATEGDIDLVLPEGKMTLKAEWLLP